MMVLKKIYSHPDPQQLKQVVNNPAKYQQLVYRLTSERNMYGFFALVTFILALIGLLVSALSDGSEWKAYVYLASWGLICFLLSLNINLHLKYVTFLQEQKTELQ